LPSVSKGVLPHPSTLSRFLNDVDAPCVEALRALFLSDLITRTPFASPGGLWDREGKHWVFIDIDGTRTNCTPTSFDRGA
jgi:hypothetical protein